MEKDDDKQKITAKKGGNQKPYARYEMRQSAKLQQQRDGALEESALEKKATEDNSTELGNFFLINNNLEEVL